MRASALLLVLLCSVHAAAQDSAPAEVETAGARRFAWIPGGVGVLCGWAGVWLLADAADRHARLERGPDRFSPAEADAFQRASARSYTLGLVLSSVGAAAIGSAVALAVIGGPAPAPVVSVAWTGDGAAVSMEYRF